MHERVYEVTFRVALRCEGDNPDSELIPSTGEVLVGLIRSRGIVRPDRYSLVNWKEVERETEPS